MFQAGGERRRLSAEHLGHLREPASLRLLFQLRGKLNFDKNVTLKSELDVTVQAKKDLEKAAMALSNEDLRRVNALYDEIARIVASVALPALSVGQ